MPLSTLFDPRQDPKSPSFASLSAFTYAQNNNNNNNNNNQMANNNANANAAANNSNVNNNQLYSSSSPSSYTLPFVPTYDREDLSLPPLHAQSHMNAIDFSALPATHPYATRTASSSLNHVDRDMSAPKSHTRTPTPSLSHSSSFSNLFDEQENPSHPTTIGALSSTSAAALDDYKFGVEYDTAPDWTYDYKRDRENSSTSLSISSSMCSSSNSVAFSSLSAQPQQQQQQHAAKLEEKQVQQFINNNQNQNQHQINNNNVINNNNNNNNMTLTNNTLANIPFKNNNPSNLNNNALQNNNPNPSMSVLSFPPPSLLPQSAPLANFPFVQFHPQMFNMPQVQAMPANMEWNSNQNQIQNNQNINNNNNNNNNNSTNNINTNSNNNNNSVNIASVPSSAPISSTSISSPTDLMVTIHLSTTQKKKSWPARNLLITQPMSFAQILFQSSNISSYLSVSVDHKEMPANLTCSLQDLPFIKQRLMEQNYAFQTLYQQSQLQAIHSQVTGQRAQLPAPTLDVQPIDIHFQLQENVKSCTRLGCINLLVNKANRRACNVCQSHGAEIPTSVIRRLYIAPHSTSHTSYLEQILEDYEYWKFDCSEDVATSNQTSAPTAYYIAFVDASTAEHVQNDFNHKIGFNENNQTHDSDAPQQTCMSNVDSNYIYSIKMKSHFWMLEVKPKSVHVPAFGKSKQKFFKKIGKPNQSRVSHHTHNANMSISADPLIKQECDTASSDSHSHPDSENTNLFKPTPKLKSKRAREDVILTPSAEWDNHSPNVADTVNVSDESFRTMHHTPVPATLHVATQVAQPVVIVYRSMNDYQRDALIQDMMRQDDGDDDRDDSKGDGDGLTRGGSSNNSNKPPNTSSKRSRQSQNHDVSTASSPATYTSATLTSSNPISAQPREQGVELFAPRAPSNRVVVHTSRITPLSDKSHVDIDHIGLILDDYNVEDDVLRDARHKRDQRKAARNNNNQNKDDKHITIIPVPPQPSQLTAPPASMMQSFVQFQLSVWGLLIALMFGILSIIILTRNGSDDSSFFSLLRYQSYITEPVEQSSAPIYYTPQSIEQPELLAADHQPTHSFHQLDVTTGSASNVNGGDTINGGNSHSTITPDLANNLLSSTDASSISQLQISLELLGIMNDTSIIMNSWLQTHPIELKQLKTYSSIAPINSISQLCKAACTAHRSVGDYLMNHNLLLSAFAGLRPPSFTPVTDNSQFCNAIRTDVGTAFIYELTCNNWYPNGYDFTLDMYNVPIGLNCDTFPTFQLTFTDEMCRLFMDNLKKRNATNSFFAPFNSNMSSYDDPETYTVGINRNFPEVFTGRPTSPPLSSSAYSTLQELPVHTALQFWRSSVSLSNLCSQFDTMNRVMSYTNKLVKSVTFNHSLADTIRSYHVDPLLYAVTSVGGLGLFIMVQLCVFLLFRSWGKIRAKLTSH